MILLKREAKRLHISVNELILKIIDRELGFTSEKSVYNDLAHLGGTWSSAEGKNFEKNLNHCEEIDKELWL